MATGSGILRLARGRSSATFLDTEEGRAFLQERLAFYNKVCFLISGSFFVISALLTASGLEAPEAITREHERRAVGLHAATLVVQLVVWLGCARGRRLVTRVLRAIDAGALVLVCVGFCLQLVSTATPHLEPVGPFPRVTLLLILTHSLVVRAVFVPSPASWTAAVSAAAAMPVIAAAGFAPARSGAPGAAAVAIWMGLWALCAVVVATLTSQLVYGLRQQVREARRLGQYTLEEKLGEGGMGVVYRARHAMLRRPTAVKLLKAEAMGAADLQRFEREVQLTAGLSHPNTVTVFDYGRTPEGVFYYAMEYLEGLGLDQLVAAEGPQPPARAAHILRQVLDALAEAHGVGLVHRDVKPANIILCERGGSPDIAKVVDFGLVKRFRTEDTDVTLASTTEQTLLGTPLYMAPETATGAGDLDARSDLYALGAVAYLLVTGTPVFQGKSVVEILAHHLHTQPESLSRRLGRPVPHELEEVILRCLAKQPDDRPSSARALRDRLALLRDIDDWSDDDASRWWLQHRRVAGAVPASA
jgi:serine/threonine-protein kinase